jgi:hypothetical protein
MNSTDFLLTISELSIAVAGFSAIVVMLNTKPIKDWADADRLNLRLLLQVSALTIVFSLFPSILSVPLIPDNAWRYSLAIYGVVHMADVSSFLFKMTSGTQTAFKICGSIGVVVAILQMLVAWQGTPIAWETMYLVSLVWHLCVTFTAFALLLYGMRAHQ